jgi:hypothetical protein
MVIGEGIYLGQPRLLVSLSLLSIFVTAWTLHGVISAAPAAIVIHWLVFINAFMQPATSYFADARLPNIAILMWSLGGSISPRP